MLGHIISNITNARKVMTVCKGANVLLVKHDSSMHISATGS